MTMPENVIDFQGEQANELRQANPFRRKLSFRRERKRVIDFNAKIGIAKITEIAGKQSLGRSGSFLPDSLWPEVKLLLEQYSGKPKELLEDAWVILSISLSEMLTLSEEELKAKVMRVKNPLR